MADDLKVRQNTQGDAFTMKIGPQTFRNREKAGEALIYLARKYVLSTKFTEVGYFAGFELQFWPDRVNEVILKGKNTYVAKISDSGLGTISSMEHLVRSLESHANDLRQTLAATHRKIEELLPHTDKPFDHEGRLQTLVQRQQELMKELDLTKNHASNQLSAEPAAEVEEVIQPTNAVTPFERKPKNKMAPS
jgi:hypothetical protein